MQVLKRKVECMREGCRRSRVKHTCTKLLDRAMFSCSGCSSAHICRPASYTPPTRARALARTDAFQSTKNSSSSTAPQATSHCMPSNDSWARGSCFAARSPAAANTGSEIRKINQRTRARSIRVPQRVQC